MAKTAPQLLLASQIITMAVPFLIPEKVIDEPLKLV
jgi:hypothetical protein